MISRTESDKQALLCSAYGFILLDRWPDLSTDLKTDEDRMMYRALELATKGFGRTPSPVGSVITKNGQVIAEAFHEGLGLPHAEVQTLGKAKERSQGAELFITLEPCTHFGRTPPCITQVLASGAAKIRIGALDPNPKVHGKGFQALVDAHFDVEIASNPFISSLAKSLISPFATSMTKRRPYIVLKMASSLDGRVAQTLGVETVITGPQSGKLVHLLRDKCDAIAAGRKTVEIDDPKLTVREIVPSGNRQPLRVIFDSGLHLSTDYQVFSTSDCIVVHDRSAPKPRQEEFDRKSIKRLPVSGSEGSVNLTETMEALCEMGVSSILVEGGPLLWTSFLNAGLVDEIWWLTAPCVFGANGLQALEQLSEKAQAWLADPEHLLHATTVGRDQLQIIRIQKPL